jgi:hypothetical protein
MNKNLILLKDEKGTVFYAGYFDQVLFEDGDFKVFDYSQEEQAYDYNYPIGTDYPNGTNLHWFYQEGQEPNYYVLMDGKWKKAD